MVNKPTNFKLIYGLKYQLSKIYFWKRIFENVFLKTYFWKRIFEKTKVQIQGKRKEYCSLNPGIRTFQTVYSEDMIV